jgi:hypothetical protein
MKIQEVKEKAKTLGFETFGMKKDDLTTTPKRGGLKGDPERVRYVANFY